MSYFKCKRVIGYIFLIQILIFYCLEILIGWTYLNTWRHLALWKATRDPWDILPSILGIIISITLIYILKRLFFPQISTPINPVLYSFMSTSTWVLFNSPKNNSKPTTKKPDCHVIPWHLIFVVFFLICLKPLQEDWVIINMPNQSTRPKAKLCMNINAYILIFNLFIFPPKNRKKIQIKSCIFNRFSQPWFNAKWMSEKNNNHTTQKTDPKAVEQSNLIYNYILIYDWLATCFLYTLEVTNIYIWWSNAKSVKCTNLLLIQV